MQWYKIFKISLLIIIILTILVPFLAPSLAEADFYSTIKKLHDNPGDFTPDDVKTLILDAITLIMSFIVGVAVLFLIIGGYQYMISAGNPDAIQKAKSTITYSIVGIALAGLARSITEFISNKLQGTTNINDLITRSINTALIFFSSIAILVLIIGGYRYMISAGNPDAIQKAKSTITGAILGIIIVLLSYAIANLANNQVQGNPPLEGVLEKFINTILGITLSVSILFLIIGGYQYMTSTGNSDAIQKAKNTIMYSIIGLIIIILSYAIVRFVTAQFGVNI